MSSLILPAPFRLYPEWNVRTSFISDHLFAALSLDAQRSSHAIEVPCPDANRINEIFDSISYSKGASVLRMLSTIVGEDVFVKGVSIYLKEKAFGNGNTRDLWNGIQKASGQDIPKIMDAWTLKIGFPVLSGSCRSFARRPTSLRPPSLTSLLFRLTVIQSRRLAARSRSARIDSSRPETSSLRRTRPSGEHGSLRGRGRADSRRV